MQLERVLLGGNGHLEAALSFVSCVLSRVVRGGHRPRRGQHKDEREKSQSTVSPVILARPFICPYVFRLFLMTGSFYLPVCPTSFESVLTYIGVRLIFIDIHIYTYAPHQQHVL